MRAKRRCALRESERRGGNERCEANNRRKTNRTRTMENGTREASTQSPPPGGSFKGWPHSRHTGKGRPAESVQAPWLDLKPCGVVVSSCPPGSARTGSSNRGQFERPAAPVGWARGSKAVDKRTSSHDDGGIFVVETKVLMNTRR